MGAVSSDANNNTEEYKNTGSFVPRRFSSTELQNIPNIAGLEQLATQHSMAPSLQAFVNLGSEDDMSLAANYSAASRYALRPRVLRDVSTVDKSTTILQGRVQLEFPLCISPFAGCRAVHPSAGECAIAAAAAHAGIVYTVPHWAGTPLKRIVQQSEATSKNVPLFFQIYPHKPTHDQEGIDRNHMMALLQYLSQHAPKIAAVIVTLDTPNNGNREQTYKSQAWLNDLQQQVGGFPQPACLNEANLPPNPNPGHSASMTWEDIRWMLLQCRDLNLALILKGIVTAEDAQRAAQLGVHAIVVSNHGGRQLDGTLGTMEVIEECVQAVHGFHTEIFVDGGIRRGKDLVKCLALGAKCVFVGRPILWGLSVGGQDGVTRVLDIFKEEYETVMQLLGCAQTRDVSRNHVHDRQPQQQLSHLDSRAHDWWIAASWLVTAAAAFALGRRSVTSKRS